MGEREGERGARRQDAGGHERGGLVRRGSCATGLTTCAWRELLGESTERWRLSTCTDAHTLAALVSPTKQRVLARVMAVQSDLYWGELMTDPACTRLLQAEGLLRDLDPDVPMADHVAFWAAELNHWCASFWSKHRVTCKHDATHKEIMRNTTRVRVITWRLVDLAAP